MKKEQMVLAGIAGYMMMNRGNSGFGGLGQGQSTEQAPTYALPSTWSREDWFKDVQVGPSNPAKYYGHEIHSWYTTHIFTNNPSDMNMDRAWEGTLSNLVRAATNVGTWTVRGAPGLARYISDSGVTQGSEHWNALVKEVEGMTGSTSGYELWSKRYAIAVTAILEQEMMKKLQPYSSKLITTNEHLTQVVGPAIDTTIRNYAPEYKKAIDALIEATRPKNATFPAIPN
jgi:hypothetical protein